MKNYMKLEIAATGANESFARSAVAAFALPLNPSLAELSDIKTAVSEAVTNCIVHAYPDRIGDITLTVRLYETGRVTVKIRDKGCGIEDVGLAMEPLYTTGGEERSGLGFSVMESFTDRLKVTSKPGKGTMEKLVARRGGDTEKAPEAKSKGRAKKR